MNSPSITYAPRPDATPQAEPSVLAAVYRIAEDVPLSQRSAGHILSRLKRGAA